MGIFDRLKKKAGAWQGVSQKESSPLHAEPIEKKEKANAPAMEKSSVAAKGSAVSNRILVRPLVSERAAHAESMGQYTFVVSADANKSMVKTAVRELYGVMPVSVNIVNTQGKARQYGRYRSYRSDAKKAIVTLKKGDAIHIHEGV